MTPEERAAFLEKDEVGNVASFETRVTKISTHDMIVYQEKY